MTQTWFTRARIRLSQAAVPVLARWPLPKGRGFLIRNVLWRLLPAPPAGFIAELTPGATIALYYKESIGLAHLLDGGFERHELDALQSRLEDGDVVFDVGANIGYLTIPLALSVASTGRVIACEPERRNLGRLRENLALNDIDNVTVKELAIGADDGEIMLQLADDSVYHTVSSAGEVPGSTLAHATGRGVVVRMATLDTVWAEEGRPAVAALKIDVEGAEVDVVRGGAELISACRPVLLIETSGNRLAEVRACLAPLEYAASQPPGFAESNHLFVPAALSEVC